MIKWLNLLVDSTAQGIGWATGIILAIWFWIVIGAWPL